VDEWGTGQAPLHPSVGHPFWVKRGESAPNWMQASQIQAGDSVQSLQGAWRRVVAITLLLGQETVYNFTVDKDHDYFVGETGFLVHNVDCEPCKGRRLPKNWLPLTNPPQMPPVDIPPGFRIRTGQPWEGAPNGYWRMEKFDPNNGPNGSWQGINPSTGKPGPQPDTHVEYPPGMCPLE